MKLYIHYQIAFVVPFQLTLNLKVLYDKQDSLNLALIFCYFQVFSDYFNLKTIINYPSILYFSKSSCFLSRINWHGEKYFVINGFI